MWTFLAILAVVLTVMALGVLALPRPKRTENEPGADVRPIAGSRDDRHRHGAE